MEDFINEVIPSQEEMKKFDDQFQFLAKVFSQKSQEFHIQISKVTQKRDEPMNDDMFNFPIEMTLLIREMKDSISSFEDELTSFPQNVKTLISSTKNCKKNILVRLKVIIESLRDLERNVKLKSFSPIKKNIQILDEYFEAFDKDDIEQIKKLKFQYNEKKVLVLDLIKDHFFIIFKKHSKTKNDVIEIIKMLSNESFIFEKKMEIIKMFVFEEMKKYNILFKQIKNQGLNNYNKRFMWILQSIKKNEELFSLFPNNWYFVHELITEFGVITIKDLINQLQNYNIKGGIDVLYDVYQMVNKFEKEMNKKYGILESFKLNSIKNNIETQMIETDFEIDQKERVNTSKEVAEKFKLERKKLFLKRKKLKIEAISKVQVNPERNYKFLTMISPGFRNYMYIFQDYYSVLVKGKVKELLLNLPAKPKNDHYGTNIMILFDEVRKSISTISTGEILFNICLNVFKPNMECFIQSQINYCNDLIVKKISGRLNKQQFFKCLYVSKTMMYLSEEIPNFQKVLIKTIQDHYKMKLKFDEQERKCIHVIPKILEVLVQNHCFSIKKQLNEIPIKSWIKKKKKSLPMDRSQYVLNLFSVVAKECKMIINKLPLIYGELYVGMVTSDFINLFFRKFLTFGKLNEFAKIQLKLDVTFLKNEFKMLIKLHEDFVEKQKISDENRWSKIDLIFNIVNLNEQSHVDALKMFKEEFKNNATKELFEKILKLRGWSLKSGNGNKVTKTFLTLLDL